MSEPGDFDLDLEIGELAEGIVRDMLTRRQIVPGRIRFEIKREFKTQETGNLFFEIESWGRESGLQITKADWYVIDFAGHGDSCMLFLEVRYLIPLLEKCLKNGTARIVKGGDKNKQGEKTSTGMLISVKDFIKAGEEG